MIKADDKTEPQLILVLGDQLTPNISSLAAADRDLDIILMAEVAEENSYVRHHKKKIAFILSAMRHFAAELEAEGWNVDYVRLDDPDNTGSLSTELVRALERHDMGNVVITEPGEWRLLHAFEAFSADQNGVLKLLPDDRFLCSREAFAYWASGRKQLRMENFYRDMRRKTGLLMDEDEPAGGRWNYDRDNRRPPDVDLDPPSPLRARPDDITKEVISSVVDRFGDHFGTLDSFWFAVSREKAQDAFSQFLKEGLPRFGDYQDAMVIDEPFLFHAVVALYLNVGLLDPLDVCRKVEARYRDGGVPINAAEGFIRQIIGWREYVRGIYWLQGPDYVEENFFDHTRSLPDFFWTGDTDLACLRACVNQTRDEAYAHHIQRLMVTGNFAMLSGVDPRQVHEWYLAVYADAFEWVELPNTLGMSQFADGGLLGSKPYAASGNYINRMSNYCSSCRYKVAEKTGPAACPFNYLYWDFLARNRSRLGKNPRLGRAYATWDRFDNKRQRATRNDAKNFLCSLDKSEVRDAK